MAPESTVLSNPTLDYEARPAVDLISKKSMHPVWVLLPPLQFLLAIMGVLGLMAHHHSSEVTIALVMGGLASLASIFLSLVGLCGGAFGVITRRALAWRILLCSLLVACLLILTI